MEKINRRSFLKSMALAGGAMMYPAVKAGAAEKAILAAEDGNEFPSFGYKNGKFKVVQFTDTHYITKDPRSERAMKNVVQILDTEKPDLVIHTGDVIFGNPANESAREILAPMSERNIPFAVALGNHDEDFESTREEIFNYIRTIPGCVNTPKKDIYGYSNDVITVKSGGKVDRVFYLFDSMSYMDIPEIKGYDYIHFDQIGWYKEQSKAFTAANGGKPVPAIAFFHIPLREYNDALRETHRIFKGNLGEEPCSPDVNSGLFINMREMGDVEAVVTGHDHDNDYAMKWRNIFLMYGRYSGCDTVYNNLKPNGARVFEFTEGKPGFRSWIRLYGGVVTQDLNYPDDFKTY